MVVCFKIGHPLTLSAIVHLIRNNNPFKLNLLLLQREIWVMED